MASSDTITLYDTSTSGTGIGDTFTHTYMCRDLENGTAGAATGHTLVEQLERANRQLKAQLAETIDSNNKWLSYDRKRDELVNSLLLKNQELQQQLDARCPPHQCEDTRNPQAGTSSNLQAGTSSNLQAGTSSNLQAGTSSNLQADLLRYRQKAEQEEALRTHLETVTKRQQQYIHQLQAAPQRPEDHERIQLLQSQVQVFSEDFQQERHDRERTQGRLSELQVEVELLREQLCQFQQSHMAFLADRRRSTMDVYRDEYRRQVAARQQPNSSPARLIAHGQDTSPSYLRAHGQDTSSSHLITHGGLAVDVHLDGHDDDDVIDVPMACGVRPASQTRSFSTSGLECPKCHQQFPVNDPLAFLEHNEQCEV